MIRKHVLTAVFMTAALLLTGCLMEGPVVPSGTVQTTPPGQETEAHSEKQTYDELPVIDPIPSEWGGKEPEGETAPESVPTLPEVPETGGESIETTAESSEDVTGESIETTAAAGEDTTGEEGGETPSNIEKSSAAESGSGVETESGTTSETTTAPAGPPEDVSPDTEEIALDPGWKYADESQIHSGTAVLYHAKENSNGIVIGVNAGHGTSGGESAYTYCHPDHTPKVTGGTTAEGSLKAMAVSSGMEFKDGTPERTVTLKTARYLRDLLLANGYDVLMLRDGSDVQLDNVARTVISNNTADIHIAIHWDGDGYGYDKGAYFMSVPEELKSMYPVSEHWLDHDRLGRSLIFGCKQTGYKVWNDGETEMDLTQTSYSTIPSAVIEMGNEYSKTDDEACRKAAEAIYAGIDHFFFWE